MAALSGFLMPGMLGSGSTGEALAFLSRAVELLPGDLLMTGTPAGVSAVKPGDVLHGTCEGVGEIRVAYRAR